MEKLWTTSLRSGHFSSPELKGHPVMGKPLSYRSETREVPGSVLPPSLPRPTHTQTTLHNHNTNRAPAGSPDMHSMNSSEPESGLCLKLP